MDHEQEEGIHDAPVDGPAREGSGVARSDPGASSQGTPGDATPSQGIQGARRTDGPPEPQDTNERADDKATVVQPD